MLGNHADQFMTTPMRTTVVTQATARNGEMPAPRPGAHHSNTVEAASVPHPSRPTGGMLPGLGFDPGFLPGMNGSDFMPGMQGIGFLDTLTPTQKLIGGLAAAGAVYFLFLRPKGGAVEARKSGKRRRKASLVAASSRR